MLEPWVIEEILRRERERERAHQLVLDLPLPEPEAKPDAPREGGERGVVVVDVLGDEVL